MRFKIPCLALIGLLLACPVFGDEEEAPPLFKNVAEETGLASGPAQRVAFADINGDGFCDCLVGSIWKEKSFRLYLNVPGPSGRTFKEQTENSGLVPSQDRVLKEWPNLFLLGDFDNDSDLDAFAGMNCDFENPNYKGERKEHSCIFLNDGKGCFTALDPSGVEANPATTCAATLFDFDLDGRLDLFVGNWYREYGVSVAAYPDRLYRGLGDGRFKDVTEETGLMTQDETGLHASSKPVYGAAACDYNNDGYPDLLVCVYGRQWNFLWKNQEGKTFCDVAEATGFDGDSIRHGRYPDWFNDWLKEKGREPSEDESPFRSNGNTFSAATADFDCDGDMDIFLGEITHAWAGDSSDLSCLLVNRGREHDFAFDRRLDLVPRTHESPDRWNQGDMHVAWLDYDLDGLQDLLISSGDYPDGQYLRLFKQTEDHRFKEVTAATGLNWESSSGISLCDFDRDGDIDILAGKSWFRMPAERCQGEWPAPALFRNDVDNGNHWITVFLKGKGDGGSNRFGIGARIIVKTKDRVQMQEIPGGQGHCGQFNPPEALFGLGDAASIDSITVRWPNKTRSEQTFKNVKADCFIQITEGGGLDELKFNGK